MRELSTVIILRYCYLRSVQRSHLLRDRDPQVIAGDTIPHEIYNH